MNPEKKEIMDSYWMLCRSKEELCMLHEEVQNIITFYETKRKKILDGMKSAADNHYNRGITSLLHVLLEDTSTLLQQAQKAIDAMCEENEDELYSNDSDLDDYCDDNVDEMLFFIFLHLLLFLICKLMLYSTIMNQLIKISYEKLILVSINYMPISLIIQWSLRTFWGT